MKRILLSLFMLSVALVNAQTDEYGYTTVELSMGAGYENRVFFDLSENSIQSHTANNWDVAFWRNGSFEFGSRINDAQNIEVYEASSNPADWDAISISNIGSWGEPLYNPDLTENLGEGAFEQGSASYGWGEYNPGNHHVEGTVIFVLKYLDDESYVKFMIEDYFGGYTFKYAKWNGSSWDATQTKTVANGSNNNYFNYFSFDTNDVVTNIEPEIGTWDLMFTRYWTFYNGELMYRMSGVLQNPDLDIARAEEIQATDAISLPSESNFSKVISTIGHSWKPAIGDSFDNVAYYIKQGDQVYRLYFIENGGSANGNMFFKYKNVTDDLETDDFTNVEISVYPNPVVNQLNISAKELIKEIKIYSLDGQLIHATKTNLSQTNINLSSLKAGVYIAQIVTESGVATKKIVKK